MQRLVRAQQTKLELHNISLASTIGVGGICMIETVLRIEGMHCGACIRRVTQSLQNAPGVEIEEVRLGAAWVKTPIDLGAETLIAGLSKAGFTAHVEK
jgi:copper chaperone